MKIFNFHRLFEGNIRRPGSVPKFSDLEVIALSLTAESESIDSEKWLFDCKLQEYKDCFPNLISRREYNDRRKKTARLCEEIRKRIAMKMDGGEEQFFVDSKPIPVCRVARGKRCKMGKTGDYSLAPDFGFCASQDTYYYGYKLHAICGVSGMIHSYDLSKASVHDLHYMKDVKWQYHDCSIYGDKGYIGADVQLDLFETAHIRLECPYRLNQKNRKTTLAPLAKARKRIETIFFATDRPVYGHKKLCKNDNRSICRNHWQNQCTDHFAICEFYQQQTYRKN